MSPSQASETCASASSATSPRQWNIRTGSRGVKAAEKTDSGTGRHGDKERKSIIREASPCHLFTASPCSYLTDLRVSNAFYSSSIMSISPMAYDKASGKLAIPPFQSSLTGAIAIPSIAHSRISETILIVEMPRSFTNSCSWNEDPVAEYARSPARTAPIPASVSCIVTVNKLAAFFVEAETAFVAMPSALAKDCRRQNNSEHKSENGDP